MDRSLADAAFYVLLAARTSPELFEPDSDLLNALDVLRASNQVLVAEAAALMICTIHGPYVLTPPGVGIFNRALDYLREEAQKP